MDNENRERQPPLLLTIHFAPTEKQCEKQSIYRPLESQTHTTCIPILVYKRILASTHGWLVLMDLTKDECCLWNPGSKDMIELPMPKDYNLYNKCVLSKHPTEPDCHILFTSVSTSLISFCKIGDADFVQADHQLVATASFQGKIYGVVQPESDYEFVTIEFVGRTMELKPILINGEQPWKAPRPDRDLVVCHETYLIDSGNDLLLVIKDFTHNYMKDDSQISVFRVDINTMKCTELDEIGDQTIFIGYNGTGFCCSSWGSNKIKPNSIYYTLSFGEYVYVYDLDDKSTSSWLPRDVGGQVVANFWVDPEEYSSLVK